MSTGIIIGLSCLVFMLAVPRLVVWALRPRPPTVREPWKPDEHRLAVRKNEARITLSCTLDKDGRLMTMAEALAYYRKHNPSVLEHTEYAENPDGE